MAEKWIIGTGFTRGIGYSLAEKIQEEGYKIIHLGRKKTGLENEFIWWDLLNPISDNPVGELHKKVFGKDIYGFYYGAGVMPMIEIPNNKKDSKRLFWQSQTEAMRVNYLACAELIEELLPFLFSPDHASDKNFVPFIAHLSSLAAVDPYPGFELYGATKAAALHYFTWLGKRLTTDQLVCLSIHPGNVYTDMVKDVMKNERKDHPVVKVLSTAKQENRMITPEEAASRIFDFLFYETDLKAKAHGKLFLADKHLIL